MLRERYLLLVKRWHPDRYATDPANQAYAAEKMREINCAYQLLKGQAVESVSTQDEASTTAAPKPSREKPAAWDSSRNEEIIQAILRGQRRDVSLSRGRLISLVLAAAYLLGALVDLQRAQLVEVLALLILSLWGIWYGEEGEGLAQDSLGRPVPVVVLKLAAWLCLLLPLAVAAVGEWILG